MWRRNGLTIVMLSLFAVFWAGHALVGFRHEIEERREHGEEPIAFGEYLRSGEFWESTAENWESEFLQMAAFVWLTVFLRQKGSSQSRPVEGEAEADRAPRPRRGAPWPVHRGGLLLALYERSLTLSLVALFLFSFGLHAVAGRAAYNAEQAQHGQPAVSVAGYVASSRFWFESLQNWQSEFLAVAAIVVLSVFLRQRGSPESKPVDAPHAETEA
ncbi:MAG TPA: DUF6766 family protein [Anaeromyxobacter sp.]|nr:DUF6766 family protein [Anaeromyxobacter sp.]